MGQGRMPRSEAKPSVEPEVPRCPSSSTSSPTATCTSSSRPISGSATSIPAYRHAAPVGLTEMRRDMRVKVKSHVILRMGAVRPVDPTGRRRLEVGARHRLRARRGAQLGSDLAARGDGRRGHRRRGAVPDPRAVRARPRHAAADGAGRPRARLRRRHRARLQRLDARLLRRVPDAHVRLRHGGAARRRATPSPRRGAASSSSASRPSSWRPARVNRRPWHHPPLRSAVGRVRAAQRADLLPRRRPELPQARLLARDPRQADDVAHLQPAARHHDRAGQPAPPAASSSASRSCAPGCSRATARGRRGCSTGSTSTTSGSAATRRPTCA